CRCCSWRAPWPLGGASVRVVAALGCQVGCETRGHRRRFMARLITPFVVGERLILGPSGGSNPWIGGARMTAVTGCPTCGTEPLESARFCHGCGAAVSEPDKHAEYKQVTVLFADVVRSMDIAAAVGAERLREIMTELVGRGAAVVRRYGGTLEKFTG